MPTGNGCWYFKNGNSMDGRYEVKKAEVDDDPEGSGNEGAAPKNELIWHPKTTIAASAELVNSV